MTKPSESIAHILDICPETSDAQAVHDICGRESGYEHLTVITRGKTTAWKHTIITEEMDVDNLPAQQAKIRAAAGKEILP